MYDTGLGGVVRQLLAKHHPGRGGLFRMEEITGIPYNTLHRWAHDRGTADPSPEHVNRIARVYKLSHRALWDAIDETYRQQRLTRRSGTGARRTLAGLLLLATTGGVLASVERLQVPDFFTKYLLSAFRRRWTRTGHPAPIWSTLRAA